MRVYEMLLDFHAALGTHWILAQSCSDPPLSSRLHS